MRISYAELYAALCERCDVAANVISYAEYVALLRYVAHVGSDKGSVFSIEAADVAEAADACLTLYRAVGKLDLR